MVLSTDTVGAPVAPAVAASIKAIIAASPVPVATAATAIVPIPSLATPLQIPVADWFRQLVVSKTIMIEQGADALWTEVIEPKLPAIATVFLPHSIKSYTDMFLSSVTHLIPDDKVITVDTHNSWVQSIVSMFIANEPVMANFVETVALPAAAKWALGLAGITIAL